MTLQHRGPGEPCATEDGPRQLLEVQFSGLILNDARREEVEMIGKSLAGAMTPAPEISPTVEKDAFPICYFLEGLDVSAYVGPSMGQPTWFCSLPCVHLRNVLKDFDDIWKYTLSGLPVTRDLTDPLGTERDEQGGGKVVGQTLRKQCQVPSSRVWGCSCFGFSCLQ